MDFKFCHPTHMFVLSMLGRLVDSQGVDVELGTVGSVLLWFLTDPALWPRGPQPTTPPQTLPTNDVLIVF